MTKEMLELFLELIRLRAIAEIQVLNFEARDRIADIEDDLREIVSPRYGAERAEDTKAEQARSASPESE